MSLVAQLYSCTIVLKPALRNSPRYLTELNLLAALCSIFALFVCDLGAKPGV
jgi:hypothetical protein